MLGDIHQLTNPNPPSHSVYNIFFVLLLIYIEFNLILYWPGIFDNDSIDQWNQIISGKFTNYHPIVHTLLLYPFAKLSAPWGFAILQSLAFFIAYILAIKTFRPKLNLLGVIFTLLFIITNPAFGISLSTFWKDTLFSILIFLSGLVLVRAYRNQINFTHSITSFLLIVILFYLIGTIRHNGIFVIGLLILASHALKLKIIRNAALTSIIVVLLTPYVMLLFGIEPRKIQFDTYASLHSIAGYYIKNPHNNHLLSFIDTYIPQHHLESYNPEGANWIILNNQVDHIAIQSDRADIHLKFAQLFFQDPSLVSTLLVERAQLALKTIPDPAVGIYHFQLPSLHPDYPLLFKNTMVLQKMQETLEQSAQTRPVQFFWSPVLLLLFNIVFVLARGNRLEKLLLLFPSFVSYFSVITVLPAQDYRYFLYLLYITPITFGLFISDLSSLAKRKM